MLRILRVQDADRDLNSLSHLGEPGLLNSMLRILSVQDADRDFDSLSHPGEPGLLNSMFKSFRVQVADRTCQHTPSRTSITQQCMQHMQRINGTFALSLFEVLRCRCDRRMHAQGHIEPPHRDPRKRTSTNAQHHRRQSAHKRLTRTQHTESTTPAHYFDVLYQSLAKPLIRRIEDRVQIPPLPEKLEHTLPFFLAEITTCRVVCSNLRIRCEYEALEDTSLPLRQNKNPPSCVQQASYKRV